MGSLTVQAPINLLASGFVNDALNVVHICALQYALLHMVHYATIPKTSLLFGRLL